MRYPRATAVTSGAASWPASQIHDTIKRLGATRSTLSAGVPQGDEGYYKGAENFVHVEVQDSTSRGVPTLQIMTPSADQVSLATNNVSATVPIEISLSNFTLPVDGQWRLWVNGVDYGAQLTNRVDVERSLGATRSARNWKA